MENKEVNWYQNIEVIFTENELEEFVKQKVLEKVEINGEVHYIKYKCKRWVKG